VKASGVARGAEYGRVNPTDTLALLKDVTPEWFTDETGERIFELCIDLWTPPDGTMFHEQSADDWSFFLDLIGVELPAGTDLGTIIVDDFVTAANTY
jgi:hypothetical protein